MIFIPVKGLNVRHELMVEEDISITKSIHGRIIEIKGHLKHFLDIWDSIWIIAWDKALPSSLLSWPEFQGAPHPGTGKG